MSTTVDLGKISLTPMNEYVHGTQYEKLDLVTYQRGLFIAKENNQNILPTVTATWMKIGDFSEGAIMTDNANGVGHPDGQTITVDANGTFSATCKVVYVTEVPTASNATKNTLYIKGSSAAGYSIYTLIGTTVENVSKMIPKYAGASSAGGSATSAVKLQTARTIQTNLASTSSASFNGTANVTPGVTGVLPVANGGTGTDTLSDAFRLLSESQDLITDQPVYDEDRIMIEHEVIDNNYSFVRTSVTKLAEYIKNKIGNATTSIAGLMSATDKSKLDKITVGYLTMGVLGLKGKTSSVADFFSALVAKGYDKLGVLHFLYDNANAGNITGSGITISINGCQCILTTRSDSWNRKNAIISICDKTYNVWAQYDNGTSPSNSGIFDLTSAIKLNTARTIQTKLNSTSSASFDGTGNVTPGVTGTLPVSNGGTGQTTLNAGANAFINSLETGTAVPTGGAYFVCQDYAGGNNNVYYRRPISTIWDYIKNQMGTKGSATQPIYMNGGVPTACTYTLSKSVPSNAVFTDTNTWRPVQNNLTSTSTSDCLSAYQGKVLKGLIDGKPINSVGSKYLTSTTSVAHGGAIVSQSISPGTYIILVYLSNNSTGGAWFGNAGSAITDSTNVAYGTVSPGGTLMKVLTLSSTTIGIWNATGSTKSYGCGTCLCFMKIS